MPWSNYHLMTALVVLPKKIPQLCTMQISHCLIRSKAPRRSTRPFG